MQNLLTLQFANGTWGHLTSRSWTFRAWAAPPARGRRSATALPTAESTTHQHWWGWRAAPSPPEGRTSRTQRRSFQSPESRMARGVNLTSRSWTFRARAAPKARGRRSATALPVEPEMAKLACATFCGTCNKRLHGLRRRLAGYHQLWDAPTFTSLARSQLVSTLPEWIS